MLIERNYSGDYIISEIVAGFLFKRRYCFYRKSEAIKAFKQELRAFK